MNSEERKKVIEEIQQLKDDSVLSEIQNLLARNRLKAVPKRSFLELAGTLTDEEADKMIKDIDEHCGQINPDDWK